MPRLALFLLGPPRIERDGEPVEIRRRKAVALLIYLAVTGHGHSRDALATLFWPELDQGRARAGLRRALTALRKGVGESFLDVDRESVGLNRDADIRLDVAEFQERLAECRAHGHPQDEVCPACLPLLTEATALYCDDLLTGFTLPDSPSFDEWHFFQGEGLRTELANALERLARAHSSRSEFDQAIAYARRWLALDPLHEPAHRCLMRLYAQSGQRAAALRQYGECERVLQGELDVSPEEETTHLYEAIKEDWELPPHAAPVSPPTAGRKHNLPVQLTPFVGREAALAEIKDHLRDPDCRLLTLVGPGGSGKTWLALEAATAQLDHYTHGVWFVSLAPLQSVDAIVPTVAGALGFRFHEEGVPQQQLLDYLRQKSLLLIMDNYEHLLEGAGLVTEILKTASEVNILATSRARLNVGGEYRFQITGMDFPKLTPVAPTDAVQYSAVKLFLQGARRAQPGFDLTDENLGGVVDVCRVVEGMPLAIRLAAAWVRMLSPQEIAAEISQGLDFLETDLHDVPERQRSVRAIFDHSWKLLAKREQEVFQALSVFRGGFTRDAAREVAGASLRELRILVDKSLLHRTPAGWYEVHELLRQYVAEKLAATSAAWETAHDRHAAYYAATLQQWAADLKGPRQQTALAEMDTEIENARAAWDWAVEQGRVEWLDQAIDGLCRFYEWRGRRQEGEVACRAAAQKLAMASGEGLRVWAKTLAWQSGFSETERANQLLRQSLALLERSQLANEDIWAEKAFILLQMGVMAWVSAGDLETERRLLKQSLALYQALGDQWGQANVLEELALAFGFRNIDEMKRLLEESLSIRRALGDRRGVGSSLALLGRFALSQGWLEEGERLVRESNTIFQEMGERRQMAWGFHNLGAAMAGDGRFAEALTLEQDALAIYNDLGIASGMAGSNIHVGEVKTFLGKYEEARAHGQTGLALAREADNQLLNGGAFVVLGGVALVTGAHAEAQEWLQRSVAVFRDFGQPDALSSTLAMLGVAARGLGQYPEAGQLLFEALRTASEIRGFFPLIVALPCTALLLADQGKVEQAVELYALASRYPFVANSRWFEDVAGKHIAAVAATLPPEVVAAAQERGRARDLDAAVAELLVELEGQ
jgi:predicted ATPase/DNA-binding SARP family transcriptional activator